MPKKEANKILIFSAHSDDADFSCAGSIAKWTDEGKEIIFCIITDGSKGITHDKYIDNIIDVRQKEERAVAGVLGIKEVIFLDEVDGELENTSEVRKKLVKVIRQVKPDLVMCFDPANLKFDNFYRFHRDHRISGEAVFDASYPASGSKDFFPELLNEGLEKHDIKEIWFYGSSEPNIFIDISDMIDKKLEALCKHESQFENLERLCDKAKELAEKIGKGKGMEYAEAFRKIKLE